MCGAVTTPPIAGTALLQLSCQAVVVVATPAGHTPNHSRRSSSHDNDDDTDDRPIGGRRHTCCLQPRSGRPARDTPDLQRARVSRLDFRTCRPAAAVTATLPGSEYAALSREVRSAGLLRRRYGYYALKITSPLAALAGAWVGFALLGDSWWQLFIAAALAIVFAQLAFIGHDAGHRQIFRTRRPNDALGTSHGRSE